MDILPALGAGVESVDSSPPPAFAPSMPKLSPLQRIQQMRLGVQIQKQENQKVLDASSTLPAILSSIESAHKTEQDSLLRIEEAKARLAAPPPFEPTTPQPGLGESLGGALAAAFSGGRGIPDVLGATNRVAMDRQLREFQNQFRAYTVDRQNATRDLAFGREDQQQAHGEGLALSKEERDARRNEALQAIGNNNWATEQNQKLDLTQLGWDQDAANAARSFGYEKELIGLRAETEGKLKAAERAGDVAMKTQIMNMSNLYDAFMNATNENQAEGAMDGYVALGGKLSARARAGIVDAAVKRGQAEDAKTAAIQGKTSGALTPEQQLSAQRFTEEFGHPPVLNGVIGGGLPSAGEYSPMVPGGLQPMGGSSNPTATPGFFLPKPAKTALTNLQAVQAAHREILGQKPTDQKVSTSSGVLGVVAPHLSNSIDAASDKVASGKVEEWNKRVQASAVQLAAAKSKYLSALPDAAKAALKEQAKTYLSALQALAQRKKENPADADHITNLQQRGREEFETKFGIDIDTAKKWAKL